ncbi:MAG: S66 peptidase family protein [Candidatus Microsaccharimonas sp.]
MTAIFAKRLQKGDVIRVIAPSRSLSIIGEETRAIATERLQQLGLSVSFSEHAEEIDDFVSSSIESRVEDIHTAFKDPQVKAILTAIGGFNSNQLLSKLDWDLIRNNPKIFCGFSDITALSNALYAKTGLVTYSGPHYSSFGMKKGFDYSLESFVAAVMGSDEMTITPSSEWSDDLWFLDQEKRTLIPNKGWLPVQSGVAEGTIIGGNLCTLILLSNTEYMPQADNIILFIEDDEELQIQHFDRNLTALSQQPWFANVKGIVMGRFQQVSEVSDELILQMIVRNDALRSMPVIANVDFGHTMPLITFPIGGHARIVGGSDPSIIITKH